jgi:hypothetical protein
MKGPRRIGVAVLAATVVTSTVACSSQAPTEAPTGTAARATFSYTCCTAADIERVYHPGDVMSIHWIVQSGMPTSATQPTQVSLSVRLTGPYADISSLKERGVKGTSSISAAPIVTSDWVGGAPTSRLVIPANASPGFYDLSTGTKSGGMTAGGASIVRVAAPGRT